jgi:hypothetical protein
MLNVVFARPHLAVTWTPIRIRASGGSLRLRCSWTSSLPFSHDFLELTVFFVVWCSLWWFLNLWSSGLWHRVISQVNAKVSEVRSSSILRVASTMKIFFRPEEVLPKHLDPSARRYCVATQKDTISPFFRFAGVALGKACLLRKVYFVVLFACVIHMAHLWWLWTE